MNLRAVTEITAPSLEPVTLADQKLFMAVDAEVTIDDALITALIQAARRTVEQQTGLSLINQTFCLTMPTWFYGSEGDGPWPLSIFGQNPRNPSIYASSRIALDRAPLVSITSVKYYPSDSDASLSTMSASDYIALTHTTPGAIELKTTASWPSLYVRSDAVQITFVAGFGTATTNVPANLIAAVKLLAKHYYDNRDAYVQGMTTIEVKTLLNHIIESNRTAGWVN